MKIKAWITRVAAVVLAMTGLGAGALGVWLAMNSIGAEPVLLRAPEAAREQVIAMMDRVCQGDFEGAGRYMVGQPSLGSGGKADDQASQLLWDAFVDSFSYSLAGRCYAMDSGVCQDVSITCLDLDSVTAGLRQRTQTILEARVTAAEDMSQIYDEHNNFREDVVMGAYVEAMRQCIAQDGRPVTVQFTVKLTFDGSDWRIVPEDALLDAISGGILR